MEGLKCAEMKLFVCCHIVHLPCSPLEQSQLLGSSSHTTPFELTNVSHFKHQRERMLLLMRHSNLFCPIFAVSSLLLEVTCVHSGFHLHFCCLSWAKGKRSALSGLRG